MTSPSFDLANRSIISACYSAGKKSLMRTKFCSKACIFPNFQHLLRSFDNISKICWKWEITWHVLLFIEFNRLINPVQANYISYNSIGYYVYCTIWSPSIDTALSICANIERICEIEENSKFVKVEEAVEKNFRKVVIHWYNNLFLLTVNLFHK